MDFRYALRTLACSPGFTAVAALTLALGIGISTVVFTIYEAVALKPIAARAPGELIRVSGHQDDRTFDYFSYAQYARLAAQAAPFAALLATSGPQTMAAQLPEPATLHARFVSNDYFAILGVSPRMGRAFQQDDRAAAIVSYSFWQRTLQEDPAVLSRIRSGCTA
jgi:hypothetical protein